MIVAEACDAAGRVVGRAHLAGVNGYDFTAGMLAWGAHAAAAGRLQGTGALGPVAAFGLEALLEGAPLGRDRARSLSRSMHRRVVRHSPTKRPVRRKFSGRAPLT